MTDIIYQAPTTAFLAPPVSNTISGAQKKEYVQTSFEVMGRAQIFIPATEFEGFIVCGSIRNFGKVRQICLGTVCIGFIDATLVNAAYDANCYPCLETTIMANISPLYTNDKVEYRFDRYINVFAQTVTFERNLITYKGIPEDFNKSNNFVVGSGNGVGRSQQNSNASNNGSRSKVAFVNSADSFTNKPRFDRRDSIASDVSNNSTATSNFTCKKGSVYNANAPGPNNFRSGIFYYDCTEKIKQDFPGCDVFYKSLQIIEEAFRDHYSLKPFVNFKTGVVTIGGYVNTEKSYFIFSSNTAFMKTIKVNLGLREMAGKINLNKLTYSTVRFDLDHIFVYENYVSGHKANKPNIDLEWKKYRSEHKLPNLEVHYPAQGKHASRISRITSKQVCTQAALRAKYAAINQSLKSESEKSSVPVIKTEDSEISNTAQKTPQ